MEANDFVSQLAFFSQYGSESHLAGNEPERGP